MLTAKRFSTRSIVAFVVDTHRAGRAAEPARGGDRDETKRAGSHDEVDGSGRSDVPHQAMTPPIQVWTTDSRASEHGQIRGARRAPSPRSRAGPVPGPGSWRTAARRRTMSMPQRSDQIPEHRIQRRHAARRRAVVEPRDVTDGDRAAAEPGARSRRQARSRRAVGDRHHARRRPSPRSPFA